MSKRRLLVMLSCQAMRPLMRPTARLLTLKHHSDIPVCFPPIRQFFTESHNFAEVCDETLHQIADFLEDLPDYVPDISDEFDVEFNGEVLTLKLNNKYTYVLNRQTPNKQIWLSSPISGPKRYDFVDGDWKYTQDNSSMIELLEAELADFLDFELEMNSVRHALLKFA